MNVIQRLNSKIISQIAAGEVIERPASAVKELIENSLDARTSSISVTLQDGGLVYLKIEDDGTGMSKDDLMLCAERHTTSKLTHDNLTSIESYGFRGEALASLAAISQLTITTHDQSTGNAWTWSSLTHELTPASRAAGTSIEIHNLFIQTPARLKFLSSPLRERQHIEMMIKRLALAAPQVSFSLQDSKKSFFNYTAYNALSPSDQRHHRICEILGSDFQKNCLAFQKSFENISCEGAVSVPTLHSAHTQKQFFFVNQRWIRDRLMSLIIKQVFQDIIPAGRYPLGVIFLTIPLDDLDVNVHPSKTEVRWRDPQKIRKALMATLGPLLADLHHANTVLTDSMQRAFQPPPPPKLAAEPRVLPKATVAAQPSHTLQETKVLPISPSLPEIKTPERVPFSTEFSQARPVVVQEQFQTTIQHLRSILMNDDTQSSASLLLGQPLGQIHHSFIVSENDQGLVLVDQHAAHERLVYEAMKKRLFAQGTLPPTPLLIRPSLPFDAERWSSLENRRKVWESMGFRFARHEETIELTHTPFILKESDYDLQDFLDSSSLVDDCDDHGDPASIERILHQTYGNLACKRSLKAKTALNLEDMDILLRMMEITPHSDQCNHGRPTWVQLPTKDIARLFERT